MRRAFPQSLRLASSRATCAGVLQSSGASLTAAAGSVRASSALPWRGGPPPQGGGGRGGLGVEPPGFAGRLQAVVERARVDELLSELGLGGGAFRVGLNRLARKIERHREVALLHLGGRLRHQGFGFLLFLAAILPFGEQQKKAEAL